VPEQAGEDLQVRIGEAVVAEQEYLSFQSSLRELRSTLRDPPSPSAKLALRCSGGTQFFEPGSTVPSYFQAEATRPSGTSASGDDAVPDNHFIASPCWARRGMPFWHPR
jgi:hypothetical protein